MAAETRGHQLGPALATAVLDRVDAEQHVPSRHAREYLAIIAACLVVVAAAVSIYAIRESSSQGRHTPPPAAGSACDSAVVTSALPSWARTGFSPDAYIEPHVTGASGDIIGVLFTDPLRSPQTTGKTNKILWIAKDQGADPLVIHAHLEGSSQDVTRSVAGGPGPSIIDMPAPGCWQLTLTWAGRTDTTALPYAP
jgi:hypothetical protein